MRLAWLALGSAIALSSCLFPAVDDLSKCYDGACELIGGDTAGGSEAVGGGGEAGGLAGGGGAGGVGGSGGGSCDASTSYAERVKCDGPLSYFRLGEPNGPAEAIDEMGEAPGIYKSVDAGQPGAIVGDDDTAVHVDWAGNWDTGIIDFGDRFAFEGALPFSFELWIKPTGGTVSAIAWMGRNNPNEAEYYLGSYMTTRGGTLAPEFCRKVGSQFQGNFCAYGSETLPLDEFTHLVTTFNGVTLKLYVDGEPQDADVTYEANMPAPSIRSSFRLGNANTFASFEGVIDEFSVYERALLEHEVCEHYRLGSGSDIQCPP